MHSYIISGDGDAARSRAREMAAAALCESSGAKPCRACRHCRKACRTVEHNRESKHTTKACKQTENNPFCLRQVKLQKIHRL